MSLSDNLSKLASRINGYRDISEVWAEIIETKLEGTLSTYEKNISQQISRLNLEKVF